MRYATKKECAGLLALLGEESLMACKKRNEPERSVGVSWVGSHIVTVESFEGQLLVRMTAALPLEYEAAVERRVHEAAMRGSGHYQFSTRLMGGFVLAEITAYGVPCVGDPAFRPELEAMRAKLDDICCVNREERG